MKNILITGGAGFVGYHLARRLTAAGHAVVLADNLARGRKDADVLALLSRPNVKLVEADLTDPAAWDALGGGYDEVYHLASINGTKYFYEMPQEVLRVGVATTLNALEWFRAKNGKPGAKILYTSSNEAYAGGFDLGLVPIPTPENVPLTIVDPYNPRWSYGGQKLLGEMLFIHYAKAYDLRMVIVRPHNFYGPRAGYEHVIPQVIARIAAKEEPFAVFGSDESRSFCYIDDAVEAIQEAMSSKATDGGTYHIGSSREILIKDLVEEMFSLMGWKPQQVVLKDSPQGSVKRRLPDVSKIKREIGWEARTPLRDGLRTTIDWYLKHPKPNHG